MLAVVSLVFCIAVQAQSGTFSLNAYGGYTFADRVKFDAAYTDIQGGFQWGAGLEYNTSYRTSVELRYLRLGTSFPLKGPQGNQLNTGRDDGNMQLILLGGNQYLPRTGSPVTPFFGGAIGLGIVDGQANNFTKFAWDARAGVKVKTKSVVSFKLQAYVQSVISAFGTDYWSTGGGGVVAVPDFATIFQFGLGGAICFDFKKK